MFHTSAGRKAAIDEATARAGGWFDPDVVTAFLELAGDPTFWTDLRSGSLAQTILSLEPAQTRRTVTEDYLDDIAAAFAQVIDSKSPYTHGHSERVTLFADLIAAELGFDGERRRWIKRAALLHDIGKLGVSNTVLDKPGKLDAAEWEAMRRHASFTEEILGRISVFRDLAAVAAAHHERLDGSGYPKGLAAGDLPLEARILAVADVFDALTADRPYRAALSAAEAFATIERSAGSELDTACIDALRRAMRRLQPAAA